MTFEEVSSLLRAADQAYRGWQATDWAMRAAKLNAAAELLRRWQSDYARLMAVEMGKPTTQGRAEIEKCALGCEYYAEHAPRMLQPPGLSLHVAVKRAARRPIPGTRSCAIPFRSPS